MCPRPHTTTILNCHSSADYPIANETSRTMLCTTNSRRSRRVTFQDTCSVQYVEPRSSLCPQERDAVWYKPTDIEAFHTEARNLCREIRARSSSSSSSGVPETDTTPRGLELRRSMARQKRKHITIQCVLLAQRRMPQQPAQVACLASRCSQWATEVAQVEGQRDFLRAYCSMTAAANLLPPLPIMTPFPLPLKATTQPSSQQRPNSAGSICQKRPSLSCCAPESHTSERCVRRRTSTCC